MPVGAFLVVSPKVVVQPELSCRSAGVRAHRGRSSNARPLHEGRAATAPRATIMRARPRASLTPLGPRPPRSLRADDRDERATRLRRHGQPVPADSQSCPCPDPGQPAHLRGARRPPWDGAPLGPHLPRLARDPLPREGRPPRASGTGLKPHLVPTIEAFAAPAPSPRPPADPRPPSTRRPLHDSTRTRAEARLALPDADPENEVAPVSRRFSLLDITSGLPDDSREADERAAARQLRDLRARVKAARAVVAVSAGLTESLQRDGQKAARFYARFDITEAQFRTGVASGGQEGPVG